MAFDLHLRIPGGSRVVVPRVSIDQIGVVERASSFTKRSIKAQSKLNALAQIIRMIDLTTLEGADTHQKVVQLCMKAKYPALDMPDVLGEFSVPPVAAVCVYPNFVKTAVKTLMGTGIQVASVATGFPSGQVPLAVKVRDTKAAVNDGATEIDMVINRGAFLSGDYQKVFDEIVAIKEVCDRAHLKVILETGELGSYDKVRLASDIAIYAGADFIKTSTGKISEAASLPVTLIMFYAVLDYFDATGIQIGVKPAGGIKTAKQAIHYLCMIQEILGPSWLDSRLFRFGASSLLNDVLRQIFKQKTGKYYYSKAFAQG